MTTITSHEVVIPALNELIDNAFKAFVAGDLDVVSSFYTDDAVLVVGQDIIKGKENMLDFYQSFFSIFTITENYPLELHFVAVNDETVTVTAHEKLVLEPKVEELDKVETELMVTFIFKKEGGNWFCCYEQASLHQPVF